MVFIAGMPFRPLERGRLQAMSAPRLEDLGRNGSQGRTGAVLRLLLAFSLLSLSSAQAASTWNGGGADGNWSTGGNWTGGTPTSANTTDLIFAGTTRLGTAGTPLNQDIGTPMTLNSLTFASGAGAFFLGGGALRFDGGASSTITQSSSSAQSIANNFSAPSSNSTTTITLAGNGTGLVTLSGIIATGNGQRDYALVKSGTGTFALTGANTYAGGTTINGGTISVNSASSLGTGALSLNAGTLEISTGFSTSRTITLGDVASTFQIDPSQTYTVTSAIGGTGALNKTGTGTMVLSGSNTFSGGAVVTAGTLQISANDRLANAGNVTVSGGTFDLQTFTDTVGAVSLTSGSIIGTGTGALTGSSYDVQSGTVSAILAGTGALTKSTSGTVTLTGANTYSGGSTINAGTVIVNSAASLGATSGGLALNAGTVEVATGFSTSRVYTLGNSASTIQVDPSQTLTITSAIGGTGALNKTGTGTLTLSGTNTYSGGSIINSGSVIANSAASLGATSGALTLNAGTLEIATGYSTGRTYTLGNAASTIQVDSSQTLTMTSAIGGTGKLNKTGAGTLLLTVSDTYSGGTDIAAGILELGGDSAGNENAGSLGSGAVTVDTGGQLRLGGSGGAVVVYNIANGITLNNGSIVVVDGEQHLQGAVAIGSGGGTLTTQFNVKDLYLDGGVTGSGALTIDNLAPASFGDGQVHFSGTNSYSGTLTVNGASTGFHGGRISVDSNNALSNASIVMNSGRDINFATTAPVFGSLAGSGNITLTSGLNL